MNDKEFLQTIARIIEEAKGLESEDYLKEEIMRAALKAVNKIISDKKEEIKAMLNTWVGAYPESREEMRKEFPEYFDSDNTNTYMSYDEAMREVYNGKKVKRALWGVTKPEISYITTKCSTRGCEIVQYCRCGECCGIYFYSEEDKNATDWYIVE